MGVRLTQLPTVKEPKYILEYNIYPNCSKNKKAEKKNQTTGENGNTPLDFFFSIFLARGGARSV